MGFPHTRETWLGMRSRGALKAEELVPAQARVRELPGSRRLWAESAHEGANLNNNVVQVVGTRELGPQPHTDSRRLRRYAAVIVHNRRCPTKRMTALFFWMTEQAYFLAFASRSSSFWSMNVVTSVSFWVALVSRSAHWACMSVT